MNDASSGSQSEVGFWKNLDGAPAWLHRLGEFLPVQPEAVYVSFDEEQEFGQERHQKSALLVLSDRYLIRRSSLCPRFRCLPGAPKQANLLQQDGIRGRPFSNRRASAGEYRPVCGVC